MVHYTDFVEGKQGKEKNGTLRAGTYAFLARRIKKKAHLASS